MPRGRLSIYQILNHFSKFKHHEEPSGIKGLDSYTECVIALILTDVCILSINLSSMEKRASTYTFTLLQKHTYVHITAVKQYKCFTLYLFYFHINHDETIY